MISAYVCEHVCIEPYGAPWSESLGITVIRKRIERIDPELFKRLGRNDILFIDSSHVIKPQGDVVFLYPTALPLLAPGVFVHAHDICTPRDYFPVHAVVPATLIGCGLRVGGRGHLGVHERTFDACETLGSSTAGRNAYTTPPVRPRS